MHNLFMVHIQKLIEISKKLGVFKIELTMFKLSPDGGPDGGEDLTVTFLNDKGVELKCHATGKGAGGLEQSIRQQGQARHDDANKSLSLIN